MHQTNTDLRAELASTKRVLQSILVALIVALLAVPISMIWAAAQLKP